ncbi:MAG: T9SS type A sorting domain-containing protein [bacterium]
MKKIIYISLVSAALAGFQLTLSGQAYTPLDLSEEATWSHTQCGFKPPWGAVYKFKILGDTIINSKQYKKIYFQSKSGEGVCTDCDFTFNRDSAELFAFIRQDIAKKKVYFVYPYLSDKEWLGYNFQIDSLGQQVVGFSLIFSVQGEYTIASIYVYQLEVDMIDSLCVDGTYRRRYFYGVGNGGNVYHNQEYWIEGIGSTQGLLSQGVGAPDWTQALYCFYNKMENVYYDTTGILNCVLNTSVTCYNGLDCSTPVSIKTPLPNDPVLIYPNPVRNTLMIECVDLANHLELTFYDHIGKIVKSMTIATHSQITPIPVDDLPAGFYFLTVRSGNFSTGKKIIKE